MKNFNDLCNVTLHRASNRRWIFFRQVDEVGNIKL